MNASEGISDEQGAIVRRIGQYVRNWWRWLTTGLEIREVIIKPIYSSANVIELGPSLQLK
tara:strand:- start:756 stop:935 length:180 start_codon:yes stop_codon:yes gene_type:complete